MKRPIAISLSPNTEPDDVALARHVLLHPEQWADESLLTRAAQIIANRIKAPAVLTSSGRQALYQLLRAFKIGAGDEVILQAFTCIAVPAPILWVGAKPVYADINPDTYNLDVADVARKITPRTKAIIVQHTFGIPGPIAEIQALARQHNLKIIEDCAHSFGATLNGQPLGSFGDAAILSFGRDKVVSCVFGGAVVSQDKTLLSAVRAMQSALPLPPPRWVTQQLRHPLVLDRLLPWYFRAALGKIMLVGLQMSHTLSKAVSAEEKAAAQPDHMRYRFSPALATLLIQQLNKLDHFSLRRAEIVKRYVASFGGPSGSLLRFPLQRKNARHLIRTARTQRILLGDWYNTPLAPADSDASQFRYVPGSCPSAEAAGQQIINLPTYPLLSDDQVAQVIQFVNTHA